MNKIILTAIMAAAFARLSCALTPGDLSRVGFAQHPGFEVSKGLAFRDETGRTIALADFFGSKPVILVMGYYRCPMLCPLINDGLINTLENLQATVGQDFYVIDISIDPNDQPSDAAQKKKLYLRRYGRAAAASGWHCLVGQAKPIATLADQIGFRYVFDQQTRQYAHPSGIVVLTPRGKISRYLIGATFDATELRDALTAARAEKSSRVFTKLFLLCYHYNPITGKYGPVIMTTLRLVSIGFVGLVAWLVFVLIRSERPTGQTG
jgi:protein SCO1/2